MKRPLKHYYPKVEYFRNNFLGDTDTILDWYGNRIFEISGPKLRCSVTCPWRKHCNQRTLAEGHLHPLPISSSRKQEMGKKLNDFWKERISHLGAGLPNERMQATHNNRHMDF